MKEIFINPTLNKFEIVHMLEPCNDKHVEVHWDDADSELGVFYDGEELVEVLLKKTQIEQCSTGRVMGIRQNRLILRYGLCEGARTVDGESIPIGCITKVLVYE